MRSAPVVAVALLLALSGCSGFLGAGDSDSADRVSTVTPAQVPEELPHPPGVNPVRFTVDADALVAAHSGIVRAGNVAIRLESRRSLLPNGSARVYRETTVLTDDRTVFYRFSNDTDSYAEGTWSNGSHTVRYVRSPRFNATKLTPVPSVPGPSVELTYGTRIRAWLNHSRVQAIERVDTDAGVRYRITATSNASGILGPDSAWTRSTVTNGSVVALVRPDGLITSMQVEYTLVTPRGRFRTEHGLAVTAGVDRLPRPDWVDRAVANRSRDGS